MTRLEGEANFELPAELIGHRTRSSMLLALVDGRALPMTMLASEAGVGASTASEHLTKLTKGGLLRVRREGRHCYYELASPEVAHALEALSRLAPPRPIRSLRADTRARALREARSCYDHLAGHLGVAVMRSLIANGMLTGGDGEHHPEESRLDRLCAPGKDIDYRITAYGRRMLGGFGLRVQRSRRRLVGYCVDWTEQRHHLAGALGAALLNRFKELDWLRSRKGLGGQANRALVVTPEGQRGFEELFNINTGHLIVPSQTGRPGT